MAKKNAKFDIELLLTTLSTGIHPNSQFRGKLLARLEKRAVFLREQWANSTPPQTKSGFFGFFGRRIYTSLVAVFLVISTGGLSTFAYTSEFITTESPLYPVKKTLESLEKKIFVQTDEEEIGYHLKMMRRRLGEARHLNEQGAKDSEVMLQFTHAFDRGISVVDTLSDQQLRRRYLDLFENAVSDEEEKLRIVLERRHQFFANQGLNTSDLVTTLESSRSEIALNPSNTLPPIAITADTELDLLPQATTTAEPLEPSIESSSNVQTSIRIDPLENHRIYLKEAKKLLERRKLISQAKELTLPEYESARNPRHVTTSQVATPSESDTTAPITEREFIPQLSSIIILPLEKTPPSQILQQLDVQHQSVEEDVVSSRVISTPTNVENNSIQTTQRQNESAALDNSENLPVPETPQQILERLRNTYGRELTNTMYEKMREANLGTRSKSRLTTIQLLQRLETELKKTTSSQR